VPPLVDIGRTERVQKDAGTDRLDLTQHQGTRHSQLRRPARHDLGYLAGRRVLPGGRDRGQQVGDGGHLPQPRRLVPLRRAHPQQPLQQPVLVELRRRQRCRCDPPHLDVAVVQQIDHLGQPLPPCPRPADLRLLPRPDPGGLPGEVTDQPDDRRPGRTVALRRQVHQDRESRDGRGVHHVALVYQPVAEHPDDVAGMLRRADRPQQRGQVRRRAVRVLKPRPRDLLESAAQVHPRAGLSW
jgi:hypothetical protein